MWTRKEKHFLFLPETENNLNLQYTSNIKEIGGNKEENSSKKGKDFPALKAETKTSVILKEIFVTNFIAFLHKTYKACRWLKSHYLQLQKHFTVVFV